MELSVTASTISGNTVNLEDILTFAGKQAGICYMPDTYKSLDVDNEAALKRIKGCMKSGHHSVIEHCYVTVLFEGVSKLFAMLLNSVQAYNTSEKSGRYTIMQDENEGLYGKWLRIFTELYSVDMKNRGISEDKRGLLAMKMAQDSARGVISITAPNTTFGYTASLRMWNYIRDWADDYIHNVAVGDFKLSKLKHILDKELQELIDFIDSTIRVPNLDNNGEFDFITNFSYGSSAYEELGSSYRQWGVQYLITYKTSFIVMAQAERHRTIKYHMTLPTHDFEYSVPNIIKGTAYESEWVTDLNTVEMPQALQVTVVEMGNVDTFVMKCKERVCGAAHEEIRELVVKHLREYYTYSKGEGIEPKIVWTKLRSCITADEKPIVKCAKGYKCMRPCPYKRDIECM